MKDNIKPIVSLVLILLWIFIFGNGKNICDVASIKFNVKLH